MSKLKITFIGDEAYFIETLKRREEFSQTQMPAALIKNQDILLPTKNVLHEIYMGK